MRWLSSGWQRLVHSAFSRRFGSVSGKTGKVAASRLPVLAATVTTLSLSYYWVQRERLVSRQWFLTNLVDVPSAKIGYPVRASWSEGPDTNAAAVHSWRLLEEKLRREEQRLHGPSPTFQIYTAADGKRSVTFTLRLDDPKPQQPHVRRAAPGDDLLAAFATVLEALQELQKSTTDKQPGKDETPAYAVSVSAQSSATSTTVTARCPEGQMLHVFLPHVGSFAAELCYSKPADQGALSDQEITALVEAYRIVARGLSSAGLEFATGNGDRASSAASGGAPPSKRPWRRSRDDVSVRIVQEKLEAMGVDVYLPSAFRPREGADEEPPAAIDWTTLAGYDDIKQHIEASLVLPLRHHEVYDAVAKGTRRIFSPNRPRAVLFAGPPGCGKTSTARIIAEQAGVPFIHVTLEAVVSRYYGASEKQLSSIFDLALELGGGAILFIDEVDALGTSRDRSDMHEATRRTLSVLLRRLDGLHQDTGKRLRMRSSLYDEQPFGPPTSLAPPPLGSTEYAATDADGWFVVVAATNRMQDLDPALLSRFDVVLEFPLPDFETRLSIYEMYAKQLKPDDVRKLAAATEGFSPRAIHDSCLAAERLWAAGIIRGEHARNSLPDVNAYLAALELRSERSYPGASSGRAPRPGLCDGPSSDAAQYIHMPNCRYTPQAVDQV
ncbi:ATPases of the AAA+ class [Cyanidioschyzon merolae strain 10D]|uniref:ATPases of the AAA+ class n=1 Tax=Cyanidioschyzon merolae (strain NIES-3377 / 10D) TaxID=280699 RepID=M1V5I7_CYAM1|nr:ATPases of the AAA+ class [Cyanidioschyzon merolae strain 10D]BAM80740.1 ATPases of the AAA+ class [Cyanidioschyzon merolae strain 10D]|eukprot:XP_005536776.1 ATPases of the AAA+ class [Cyanidioschyzon merolae strain 10D]